MTAKRRKVDIYFVLYIIALVLLIPSPQQTSSPLSVEQSGSSHSESVGQIFLEKMKLILSLDMHEEGFAINYADTVNTITIEQQDILPTVSIKNLTYDNSYTFEGEFQSDKFEFKDVGQGAWIFLWKPSSSIVSGIQRDAYDVSISIPGNERVFTVTTIVEDMASIEFPTNSGDEQDGSISIINPVYQDGGSYYIQPSRNRIRAIPNQTWENKIFIRGTSSDQFERGIEVVSDIAAVEPYIKEITPQTLTIAGTSPINQQANILISVKSKINGMVSETGFSVFPVSISSPSIPDKLYPNIAYQIDPRFPVGTDFTIESILTIGGDTIEQNTTGSIITFTPSISDTGKALRLTRLVNGKSVGTTPGIVIEIPPAPRIISVSEGQENEVQVSVRAYGGAPGNPNTVVKLIVQPDPRSITELFGAEIDCGDGCFEQKFRIKLRQGMESIRIQAVDELNQTSDIWKKLN